MRSRETLRPDDNADGAFSPIVCQDREVESRRPLAGRWGDADPGNLASRVPSAGGVRREIQLRLGTITWQRGLHTVELEPAFRGRLADRYLAFCDAQGPLTLGRIRVLEDAVGNTAVPLPFGR